MRYFKEVIPAIFMGFLALFAGCNKEPVDIPFEPFSWESSTPGEEGMDAQLLDSAFILASRYGFVDGLLVVRNGKIVAEAYFNDFTADIPHNIMSVSKSMLSAIAGLVLDGPYGLDLEDRMLDYFPQYNSDRLDPRKQDISIEHLLTMRMGIDIDYWEKDPQGICFGGNSMHVTPREMAVFGLLYLQKGMLQGKQIIPQTWVEQSLSPSTDFTHPNEWGSWKNYNYAYLWWLGQFSEYDSFMGYGYGGQFVIVFPDLNLIVVTTAKNEVPPETTTTQEWALFDLVNKYILTSIY